VSREHNGLVGLSRAPWEEPCTEDADTAADERERLMAWEDLPSVAAIHPARPVCPAVRDAVASDTGIARHAVHSALAGVAAQPSTIRAVDAAARRYGARAPQAAMLDGLRGAA